MVKTQTLHPAAKAKAPKRLDLAAGLVIVQLLAILLQSSTASAQRFPRVLAVPPSWTPQSSVTGGINGEGGGFGDDALTTYQAQAEAVLAPQRIAETLHLEEIADIDPTIFEPVTADIEPELSAKELRALMETVTANVDPKAFEIVPLQADENLLAWRQLEFPISDN